MAHLRCVHEVGTHAQRVNKLLILMFASTCPIIAGCETTGAIAQASVIRMNDGLTGAFSMELS
jgi:hypothetical protein